MGYRVDNAVIMAAGTASRFAPLSYERPKALIEVKGEVLIERQIRQLQEAGVPQIIVVVGYMKEQFLYLQDKFGVQIVENNDYLSRNNNGSIYAVKDWLKNTYVCSSDNYFSENPFEAEVDDAYYSVVYARGETKEWCVTEGADGYIDGVQIGGRDAWIMLGHTFWNEAFSQRFVRILEEIYSLPETKNMLWESIYMQHLDTLKMKMRKYTDDIIFEFDTLDELRLFDESYVCDTRSEILAGIAEQLGCAQQDIVEVNSFKTADNAAAGMRCKVKGIAYEYRYDTAQLRRMKS